MSELEVLKQRAKERRQRMEGTEVHWAAPDVSDCLGVEADLDRAIEIAEEAVKSYAAIMFAPDAAEQWKEQRDQARADVLKLRELLLRDEKLMDKMADHIFNEALFVGNGTAIHDEWKKLVMEAQGELRDTEHYEQHRKESTDA